MTGFLLAWTWKQQPWNHFNILLRKPFQFHALYLFLKRWQSFVNISINSKGFVVCVYLAWHQRWYLKNLQSGFPPVADMKNNPAALVKIFRKFAKLYIILWAFNIPNWPVKCWAGHKLCSDQYVLPVTPKGSAPLRSDKFSCLRQHVHIIQYNTVLYNVLFCFDEFLTYLEVIFD